MGKVGLLCILLISSLGQGIVLEQNGWSENEANEYILETKGNVWTHDEWLSVRSFGITPLRAVSPTELLVLATPTAVDSSMYDVVPSPNALYKGVVGDLADEDIRYLKIVYEPRLPEEHKVAIANQILASSAHLEFETVAYPTYIEVQISALQIPIDDILRIPGILWIEPSLQTEARNEVVSSLLQHGHTTETPAWDFGLNGEDVVIGVADSGIDFDHTCFRQYRTTEESNVTSDYTNNTAVGIFSDDHRKIVLYNTTIDDYDQSGHLDYRHGTHVAGTLACHDVFHNASLSPPDNGSSLAYGSQLVFQDVVSNEGWVIPDVDELLFEANQNGAILHSDSWGDDTTEYTARTGVFDGYARQMPWSLAFIAPGNNGGDVLEPANGRNIASIGATVKSSTQEIWISSAHGPLHDGRDGIFALAPGSNVFSAKGDGDDMTNNGDLRPSSGTSMSTPAAASMAAIIQQMYQEGWISNSIERSSFVLVDGVQADWVSIPSNASSGIFLSDGIIPSGTLIRATLALSTTPYAVDERNRGEGSALLHNPSDGWGVLNLSALVDFQDLRLQLETGNATPAHDVWFHDSFELQSSNPSEWIAGVQDPMTHVWNGSNAKGPFLATDERFSSRLIVQQDSDLQIRMAFPAKPEPELVDDLLLVAHLSNGTTIVRDHVLADGSPIYYNSTNLNLSNQQFIPATNETTQGLFIPADQLANITHIDVEVFARFVTPGNNASGVGLDGSRTGFSLVAKGVQPHEDNDGDGVQNLDDACPETLLGETVDEKGCSESQNDDDDDGIANLFDLCKEEDASGFDANLDGCIDDSDNDGFLDPFDACPYEETFGWGVDGTGCIPEDQPPQLLFNGVENLTDVWKDTISLTWRVTDVENDSYETGAVIHSVENANFIITACFFSSNISADFACVWNNPDDLPPYSLADMTFQLRVYAKSYNNSPFANSEYIEYIHNQSFTVHWDNPLEGPDGQERNQDGVSQRIWLWSLVGILFGFGIAYQLTKRLHDDDMNDEISDPFVKQSSKEDKFDENSQLHEDE
jgi:hypothetical protein